MQLTDLAIRNMPIPDKGQKVYWDKGLGVKVSPGGTKSFVAKHNNRVVTLGRYPTMRLKQAREAAFMTKMGDTPVQQLQSLTEARAAYLAECELKNRPATVKQYRHFLNMVDKPTLSDVTRTDIDLSSPHAVMIWRVFFNWCIRNELVDKNPFNFAKVTWASRSRVLTPDEVRMIWMYDYPPYSDYLKLQILTGQRIGQWKDYTVSNDTIVFPASIMKGKKEHTIPLTEGVASLLPIPSFNGWSKAKKRIDTHVDIPHWTIHDLRRTFSTTMASLQVPLHVTEAILAHSSGSISGVAATYNRYNYLIEMRDALEKYENFIYEMTA